ncbi:MAG: type II toxin-antitoxin system RelE/ParE family toxin [Syntrophomonadaceae bacterium]|jgi:toxin ParE1/3/4
MSEWKVVYTEQAERDLHTIFEYIAFSLLEPEIAENQSRRIMDAIAKLNKMPLRYPLYEKEPLNSKGLRVLPVDNYLAICLWKQKRRSRLSALCMADVILKKSCGKRRSSRLGAHKGTTFVRATM